ncbi:MAG: PASTA domain-containing protein [Acidobacteriia bacterium]|jgi:serine/threonine-protein kinase|nr:PASTA domain-containing protein [Terriglobia bacterium]
MGATEPPLSPWQRRLLALIRFGVAAFVLGAAAFLSFILTIQIAVRRQEVEVPRLEELTTSEAQTLLARQQLGLQVLDRVYSALPEDRVVRQSPPPGTVVKVGQRVFVVVSRGPQQVPTPLLEGRSLRVARLELPKLGLELGQVSAVYLPDYEADRIVRQNPPPQTRNTGTARVNVLVSLGAREPAYVMPDLVGLPLAQAQRRLAAAGLRSGAIETIAVESMPAGVVVGQSPRSGARVPAGAVIDLQISVPVASPRMLE